MYGSLHETFDSSETKHFILHVGTNDLNWNRPPDQIEKAIIDLASELKSEKSSVSISSIIMGADKPELNKKGNEVNHHLKELCNRKNFYLIDHSKKIKASHLNSSKLHLNRKGADIFSSSLTHFSRFSVDNYQVTLHVVIFLNQISRKMSLAT